jgi:hypothetical protein
MTRRELARGAAGALVLAGMGVVPGSAAAAPRGEPRSAGTLGPPLGPEEERILAHAALAPSGHNAQPWRVWILEKRRWIVGVDPDRKLPAVDPADRELALSIGAVVENLASAANASGLAVEMEVRPAARDAAELLDVRLVAAAPVADRALEDIRLRRTLRKDYLDDRIRPEDLDAIADPYVGCAAWFPAGSREARWLADAEVEAFRKQAWRDDAQDELSRWIRFSDEEVEQHRDGLTPATMEAGALRAFLVRHFVHRGSVMKRSFRDAGIDATAKQVSEGAGWLVVTSPDEAVSTLVDTGRRFERMALRLRERKLAAHPMSQLLEEEPWRAQVSKELALGPAPQFVLRLGYVAAYPSPVSPRRAPRAFARVR